MPLVPESICSRRAVARRPPQQEQSGLQQERKRAALYWPLESPPVPARVRVLAPEPVPVPVPPRVAHLRFAFQLAREQAYEPEQERTQVPGVPEGLAPLAD